MLTHSSDADPNQEPAENISKSSGFTVTAAGITVWYVTVWVLGRSSFQNIPLMTKPNVSTKRATQHVFSVCFRNQTAALLYPTAGTSFATSQLTASPAKPQPGHQQSQHSSVFM